MSLDNLTPSEFSKWYLLGQSVRRMMGKGEATMYSYNGVVLPKLPEWDKTVYPYAYISVYADDNPNIRLIARKTKATVDVNGKYTNSQSSPGKSFVAYTSREGEEWVENTTAITVLNSRIVWASVDVHYSDSVADVGGTLYLAASEPIPVYE